MLRRTFAKWFSSAAVALIVGTEHFQPVVASVDVDLPATDWEPSERESQQYSVVVQALRHWNDARVDAIREMGVEDGARLFFALPQDTSFKINTNKVTARAISGLDLARREMNAKS